MGKERKEKEMEKKGNKGSVGEGVQEITEGKL